jgi:hypothetical protein
MAWLRCASGISTPVEVPDLLSRGCIMLCDAIIWTAGRRIDARFGSLFDL